MTSDLPLGKSETTLGQLLIYGPHSLPSYYLVDMIGFQWQWFPLSARTASREASDRRHGNEGLIAFICLELLVFVKSELKKKCLSLFWPETPVSSSVSFL